MLNFRNLLSLIIFALVLTLLYLPSIFVVHAVDYTETFNGSLSNPLFWQSTRGTLSFQTDLGLDFGSMQVATGSNPFHYYKSVEFSTLKPDYSSVMLTTKFSSNSINQGAGYIFSDNVPSESSSLNFNNYMFYVWPKGAGTFHLFSSLCPNTNPTCSVSSQLSNGVYSMPTDGDWHDVTVKKVESHYEWFLDDVVIFTTVDTVRTVSSVGIGDPEITTGSLIWPILYIDFIGLDSTSPSPTPSPSPSPSPTSTPSPSPTPTPSPSPSPTPTPFPYLSQKDVSWAEDEYDSASSWAGVSKSGIERWGCAITSAAMILQKNGVKALDGSIVDPSKLNTWLKTQTDGYIGPGLLNWLAITRYTKESYAAGYASTKLEYSRPSATSTPVLPTILGLPGHFVVAHDEDSTNWQINDPASESAKLLPKTSTIKSINRFIPSSTDLSYMMFVTNGSVTAELKDELGNPVAIDWTDEYLSDDIGGDPSETIRSGMLAKPSSGVYRLTVTQPATGANSFKIYLYDNQAVATTEAYTLSTASTIFDITYGSSPSETKSVSKLDQTPPVLTSVPVASENPTNSLTQNWSWQAATDDDSGVSGYSARKYNVVASSYLDDWLWIGQVLSTTTNLAEGKWKLNLKAKDNAGNESSVGSSETVTIDTTAPTLSSQTTLNTTWYKTAPTVTFEYSDANMLGTYVAPTCEITTESSASYCWVKPYICDIAGNCNNDQKFSQNIKLDLTKPTISLNVWGSELKGTASDSLSGVAKVVIQLTKPGATEETIAATGTTNWNYVIDKAQIGTYTVKVMAYDNADNISSSVERTYDINASDPVQSSDTPSPTPTPPSSTITSFTDSPSPAPSPSPSGEVLGEQTIPNKMSYRWLWIIAPSSLIVYLLARNK